MLIPLAALLALPLLSLVAALDLTDYNTVYNDVQAETSYLSSLSTTAAVTAAQLVNLNAYFKKTSKDVNTTVADTYASAYYSTANCDAIANSLYNKVCPAFQNLCNDFSAHYPAFQKSGPAYVAYVRDRLKELKSDISNLAVALAERSCNGGTFIQTKCVNIFNSAITRYSS